MIAQDLHPRILPELIIPIQADVVVIALDQQYRPMQPPYQFSGDIPWKMRCKVAKMKNNSIFRHCLVPKAYQGFVHFVNILELWPIREDFVAVEVCIGREEEVVRVDFGEVFCLVCITKKNGRKLIV